MISVITPSVRPEGLKLVEKALKRQTFKNYEWIVVSPEGKKPEGLYWTIYRDYNRALKQSKGELIVSWQDYTFSDATTLEKLWGHYLTEANALVTCVGDKYSDDTWTNKTWLDPRQRNDYGRYYEVHPQDIEWNLNSCPREAIYKVGGFDEDLDRYSSLCGLDVATRIDLIGGYKFMIDQDIKTYSTEHGRLPNWSENEPFANGVWQKKIQDYKSNPILDYLEKDDGKKIN